MREGERERSRREEEREEKEKGGESCGGDTEEARGAREEGKREFYMAVLVSAQ